MTGGVAEFFDLDKTVRKQKSSTTSTKNADVLWKLINKSFNLGSICNTSIWSKEANTREIIQENGLVDGVNNLVFENIFSSIFKFYYLLKHAYTVTGMDEKLRLIRIRNPHGYDGSEWNGSWRF